MSYRCGVSVSSVDEKCDFAGRYWAALVLTFYHRYVFVTCALTLTGDENGSRVTPVAPRHADCPADSASMTTSAAMFYVGRYIVDAAAGGER